MTELRTSTRCETCGGFIYRKRRITGALTEPAAWLHLYELDWVDNVHQAVPAS